jgi:hypothetical protein
MSFKKSLQKEVVGMKEAKSEKTSVSVKGKKGKKAKVDDILLALSSDIKQMLMHDVPQPIVRNDPEGIKSPLSPLDRVPDNAEKKAVVTAPGSLAKDTKEDELIKYFKNVVEDNPGLGGVLTPNYNGQKKDLELYYESLKMAPEVGFLPKKVPLENNRNMTVKGDVKDVPKEVQASVSGKKPFSHTSLLQSLNIF